MTPPGDAVLKGGGSDGVEWCCLRLALGCFDDGVPPAEDWPRAHFGLAAAVGTKPLLEDCPPDDRNEVARHSEDHSPLPAVELKMIVLKMRCRDA